jgi:hypothetical protein
METLEVMHRIGPPAGATATTALAVALAGLGVSGCSAGAGADAGKPAAPPAPPAPLASHKGKAYQTGYPAAWRPPPPSGEKLINNAEFEVMDLQPGRTIPSASMDVIIVPQRQALDDMVTEFLGGNYAATPQFKLGGQRKVTVRGAGKAGNGEGREILSTYRRDSGDGKGTTIPLRETTLMASIDNERSLLTIRIICRAERCPAYAATTRAILDSVRITR